MSNPEWKPTIDGTGAYWVENGVGVFAPSEPFPSTNYTINAVAGSRQMTPEEKIVPAWVADGWSVRHGLSAHELIELDERVAKAMMNARLQAFEEAAKIAERHLPAGMYPEALAGAIAAAIRQHAKGEGK